MVNKSPNLLRKAAQPESRSMFKAPKDNTEGEKSFDELRDKEKKSTALVYKQMRADHLNQFVDFPVAEKFSSVYMKNTNKLAELKKSKPSPLADCDATISSVVLG